MLIIRIYNKSHLISEELDPCLPSEYRMLTWKNQDLFIVIEGAAVVELYYRGCAMQFNFEYHGYVEQIIVRSLIPTDATIALFMDAVAKYGIQIPYIDEASENVLCFDESYNPEHDIEKDISEEKEEQERIKNLSLPF